MNDIFIPDQSSRGKSQGKEDSLVLFFFPPSLFKICILLILKSILNFLGFYLWKQPFCLFVCFFISLSHLLACLE